MVFINFLDKFIIIFLFTSFVSFIWLLSYLLRKKSNRFANYIKRNDISLRYQGVSRFSVEIILNLSVVCMINFSYGSFKDLFNSFSIIIAIIMILKVMYFISYCLIYSQFYFSSICVIPNKHERHCLLFSEFNCDKSRNLLFYFYFTLYRLLLAFLLICMYNYSIQQLVLISFLNFFNLMYTISMFKRKLNNFLHTFNSIILFTFSLCLPMFLSSSNLTKLKVSGFTCIGILAIFFLINWCLVLPHIFIHIYSKISKRCSTKKNESIDKNSNKDRINPVIQTQITTPTKRPNTYNSILSSNRSYLGEEKKERIMFDMQRYSSSKFYNNNRLEEIKNDPSSTPRFKKL